MQRRPSDPLAGAGRGARAGPGGGADLRPHAPLGGALGRPPHGGGRGGDRLSRRHGPPEPPAGPGAFPGASLSRCWWPRSPSGWGSTGLMWAWCCTWICLPVPRGICRNRAGPAGTGCQPAAWCCSIPPIAPSLAGRCGPRPGRCARSSGPGAAAAGLAQQQLRRMEAVAEGQGLPRAGPAAGGGRDLALPAAAATSACGPALQRLVAGRRPGAGGPGPEGRRRICAAWPRPWSRPMPVMEQRWGWLTRRLVQEELISESDDGSQRLWLRSAGRQLPAASPGPCAGRPDFSLQASAQTAL